MPSNSARRKLGRDRPDSRKEPRSNQTSRKRYERVSHDPRPNQVRITHEATEASHLKWDTKRCEEIAFRFRSLVTVEVCRDKGSCAARKTKS